MLNNGGKNTRVIGAASLCKQSGHRDFTATANLTVGSRTFQAGIMLVR